MKNYRDAIVDMVPRVGTSSGEVVYTFPDDDGRTDREDVPVRISRGQILVDGGEGGTPTSSTQLTGEKFAADPPAAGTFGDEFKAIDEAHDAGEDVRIVDGQIVVGGETPQTGTTVTQLTADKFGAFTQEQSDQVRVMIRSGAAKRYARNLRPTSDLVPEYFPTDPQGIYFHSRPTHPHGDELHAVLNRDRSTNLVHAYLWSFMKREGERLLPLDMKKWIGDPQYGLSRHSTHLYANQGSHKAAILCLSGALLGGIDSYSGALVRTAQWTVGMGEVVRGGRFPYRE